MKNITEYLINEANYTTNDSFNKSSKNYDVITAAVICIKTMLDNLTNNTLLNNVTISAENNLVKNFNFNDNLGWYAGLMIESAFIDSLSAIINKNADDFYNIDETDADYLNKLTLYHSKFEIAKNGTPIFDTEFNFSGKKTKCQIKSVNKSNYSNSINDAIRDGNDFAIVVIYTNNNNSIKVDSIEIYAPDIDNTFDYCTGVKTIAGIKKNVIKLDKSKAAIIINA